MKPIKRILIIVLLFPLSIYAQKVRKMATDTGWGKIESNIYRITLMQPMFTDYESDGILAGNYEHKLTNKFSMVARLGLGFASDNFGPAQNPTRSSFHLYGALEARYYFSLERRIRKTKAVLNYSAPYISLEQNIITNHIALINKAKDGAMIGQTALYFNVGYQKQWGKFYLFGYFGVPLWGKRFSKDVSQNISLHGGTGLGYVF